MVDVEWFGGPMDGKVTRAPHGDLKAGTIVYCEVRGVRTEYRLLAHMDAADGSIERWLYSGLDACPVTM